MKNQHDNYGLAAIAAHEKRMTESGGGEWTVRRGEGMRRVYCLFDGTKRLLMEGKKVRLGDLEGLKMRHNAALRDCGNWRAAHDEVSRKYQQLLGQLGDCGNDSRHGDQAARLDTKRLDWLDENGVSELLESQLRASTVREAIDAAMLETGEQTSVERVRAIRDEWDKREPTGEQTKEKE